MFYLIIHLLWIPIPNCLLLTHFKNIYPQLSALVLLQILFTWPLVFFNHRNTWLPFHYGVDRFNYHAACPFSGLLHFITISLLNSLSLRFPVPCACLILMLQLIHLLSNLFKTLPVLFSSFWVVWGAQSWCHIHVHPRQWYECWIFSIGWWVQLPSFSQAWP